jgi:hypothetical protein
MNKVWSGQMKHEDQIKHERNWEEAGAASGLLATALFVAAFIAFMSTHPTGVTPYPSIGSAQKAPVYIATHLNSVRLQLLFTTLGLVLFLWFTGSVQAALRRADSELARGPALVMTGAAVGGGLMLASLGLSFSSALAASPAQAQAVPAIYTAAAVLFALGGGVLSVFFFAAAKTILATGVLGRWLGALAFVAGVLCALAFMSPFWETGILNAATGAIGLWAWWAAFVVWVFLASVTLTITQRHRASVPQAGQPPRAPAAAARGADR